MARAPGRWKERSKNLGSIGCPSPTDIAIITINPQTTPRQRIAHQPPHMMIGSQQF
jgi:hypothetical protein